MKKFNCIAIDDEPHALKILEAYISKVPHLQLLAALSSPLEAIPYLENEDVAILFLDIQMPELTGLQFLNIVKLKSSVILTTAYSEYALDSYDYDVTDYLLKPYSFERFLKAVQKVQLAKQEKEVLDSVIVPQTSSVLNTILIKGDAKNKYFQVDLNNITYVEGLRNYIAIHQKNEKKIVTLQSMKAMEGQLVGEYFLRVHKSYIVNMNHVEMMEGNALKIGDKLLPVGGSYRKMFFDWVEKKKNK